ncbi:hypothetical protein DFS34DRAFT_607689 [Phlyctochytrium arcticum]|nr:hypothetical protein DFS34DRAFT_607689 [Phlyctochytrium arcticum]
MEAVDWVGGGIGGIARFDTDEGSSLTTSFFNAASSCCAALDTLDFASFTSVATALGVFRDLAFKISFRLTFSPKSSADGRVGTISGVLTILLGFLESFPIVAATSGFEGFATAWVVMGTFGSDVEAGGLGIVAMFMPFIGLYFRFKASCVRSSRVASRNTIRRPIRVLPCFSESALSMENILSLLPAIVVAAILKYGLRSS